MDQKDEGEECRRAKDGWMDERTKEGLTGMDVLGARGGNGGFLEGGSELLQSR
jgi:hypothetical protein